MHDRLMGLRSVFLTFHIAGGVLGLGLGLFAFHPPLTPRFRLVLRRAYAAALIVLAVFLLAIVAVDWSGLAATPRIVFSVLIGLAAVILVRLFLALRLAGRRPEGWEILYVNHVYFTYISLWEGFFIVGLIDLGSPGWVVGAVAVAVLVVGGVLLNRYKRGVASRSMRASALAN